MTMLRLFWCAKHGALCRDWRCHGRRIVVVATGRLDEGASSLWTLIAWQALRSEEPNRAGTAGWRTVRSVVWELGRVPFPTPRSAPMQESY
jgi:hypothetical protein